MASVKTFLGALGLSRGSRPRHAGPERRGFVSGPRRQNLQPAACSRPARGAFWCRRAREGLGFGPPLCPVHASRRPVGAVTQ